MEKTIICIDMDAFFASVEQRTDPRLRGRPVAVIGSGHRTIITTASYEARRFGVKTGMTIYEAKRLCPSIIFVVGNNDKYTHTCRELEKIYRALTPYVEIYSIDEAFLDITGLEHLYGGPERVARLIKGRVREGFGIPCTAGIGPNVLLAKLACDMAKPDGIKRIRQEDAEAILENLPVGELWGVGQQTEKRLKAMGITTCGGLGRASASILRARFGIIGERLKAMGMGVWARPLITSEGEPDSIGHSTTLPEDIWNRPDIEAHIMRLSEMVGKRARDYGYIGKKVSITIRYPDFETFTRQKTLQMPTNDTHWIYIHALSLLDRIRLKDRIRLIGVRLAGLVKDHGQISLFLEDEKRNALLKAVDRIKDKYGDSSVTWAASLRCSIHDHKGVISPAWRPSGVRLY